MKAIAINGSPRKKWNTAQLLEKSLEGAATLEADTEIINLYDYNFKGCVSCFACHLKKNMDMKVCAYKDELTPLLNKCLEADVIIIGTPVYYGFSTGMVRSFIERLLFPLDTYYVDENGKRITKMNRIVPTAMIYTMNANEEQMEHYHIKEKLSNNENVLKGILGYSEALYSADTYQFTDYEPYTVNIFDPKHKAEVKKKQFPIDLQNAYELGKRLVNKVDELNL